MKGCLLNVGSEGVALVDVILVTGQQNENWNDNGIPKPNGCRPFGWSLKRTAQGTLADIILKTSNAKDML